MATQTSAQILDWLVKQQFLAAAQAEESRAQLPRLGEPHALARELLQRGWLTPYQANQIFQDKGDALILGDYRLLERLGEGSMGQVFKAWSLRTQRVVALKMILKEHVASNKAMERFRREIETASHLVHPHIVLVRDSDDVDGRPFMIMDFIDGIDLSRLVKQQGPLPIHLAAEYTRQAALGLQYAGDHGVVHRDIKPGNLLLQRQADGAAQVKILDFGLARYDSERNQGNRLTQVGNVILGTVDYMAPEQAENARTADIRADIYGLGCSLFYCLTGKPPFPGNTIVEKLSVRMMGPAPSVAAQRSDVPPGLDAVVRKMMAKTPAERFQMPQEVAAALQPFCQAVVGVGTPVGVQRAEVVVPAGQVAVGSVPTGTIPGLDPSGTPLARPVGAAPPMAAPIPAAALGADPFAFSHPGTSVPTAAPIPEAAPRPALPAGPTLFQVLGKKIQGILADPVRRRYWLIGVGGGLLLLVLLLVFWPSGSSGPLTKRGYFHPKAALKLHPLEALDLKEGQNRIMVATIERQFFNGPVTLSIANGPEGVTAPTVIIPADKDKTEFRVFVSFNSGARETELKVQAVAENLRSEWRLPLKVTALNPTKKKPRPTD